jgi:hypothetical protein
VFLADGAVTKENLDETGGYCTSLDTQAWHVFLTNREGAICACYTLILHRKGVELKELRADEILNRMDHEARVRYEAAIKSFMSEATDRNIRFGELAAWAIHEAVRNRLASMMMSVAAWSLYQILGNALVLGVPTFRHRTSNIEKRLGGFPLTLQNIPLGSFYDPCHKCEMEFVGFDSERPLPKFAEIIAEMRSHFEQLTTCACRNSKTTDLEP